MLKSEPAYSKTALAPSIPPFAVSVEGLTAFEKEIVAVFVDLVLLLGLPKSVGEIYGLLFASAEPLSFVEVEGKLGLSKGSVSQGLRTLRDLGAVREVGNEDLGQNDPEGAAEPGRARPESTPLVKERGARWVAAVELRKLIGSLLRERLTPYLERQDQRVVAAGAALDQLLTESKSKHLGLLAGRLEKLQTWQSRTRTVLPVIGKLL